MFIAVVAFGFFACNNASEKTTPESGATETKPMMDMHGYTPSLSSEAVIGDPKNAENVLALFRTWDDGNLSVAKDYFADSVTMFLRNGMMVSGTRDEVLSAMQGARDGYTMMKNTVHVVFPVDLKPANSTWAAIWSTEAFTDKAGVTDSVVLNETWRFDKNGKVDLMYQYGRPAAVQPMPASK